MLKLIKLEMKKIKIGGYIKSALIANLIITGILALIIFSSINDGDLQFTKYDFIFEMVGTMVKSTFVIFASVLISKFIIEEYKSKTIMIMFMYPINRKKLIASKLIIVALFTFVSVVLSNIFVGSVLCIINNLHSFTTDKLTTSLIINSFKTIGIDALVSSGMGLIPLYFGMRKKSVPTTIVSAIIIVSVVCSNNNGHSLSSIIVIPITLAIIGVFIAYLSIRNIEHVDAD